VVSINPPPQQWTGAIVVNGSLERGNTETENLGVSADATLRRQDEVNDDRFTLQAAYNFGRNGTDGDATTTTDNWMALGKYDRFWTEKWYGYALFKVEHDRIAALNYRLSPGVGVGYQWIEKPDLNFRTEAGVSYVYEDYSTDGSDDHVALRLAYHFDKSINDKVKFFHDLEWLPAIDDPSDYNLNTDAGIRVSLTEKMFSEFKFEYDRDSTPAPGRLKNDLRYTLGIGWSF
jgi:putative salt-induced outer membrane protein YdiY